VVAHLNEGFLHFWVNDVVGFRYFGSGHGLSSRLIRYFGALRTIDAPGGGVFITKPEIGRAGIADWETALRIIPAGCPAQGHDRIEYLGWHDLALAVKPDLVHLGIQYENCRSFAASGDLL